MTFCPEIQKSSIFIGCSVIKNHCYLSFSFTTYIIISVYIIHINRFMYLYELVYILELGFFYFKDKPNF